MRCAAVQQQRLPLRHMIDEVKAACVHNGYREPATTGEVMQCIYNSLSQDYIAAIERLQTHTGKTYTSLAISVTLSSVW